MNIYFLGGGNMAEAIASQLIKQNCHTIHIVNRNAVRREYLARKFNIQVTEKLPKLSVDDVLILAVKPQDMYIACQNVQTDGALVLSLAAGLSINTLSCYLGGTRRIIRIMPNTPAKVGLGVSGMFAASEVSDTDKQTAENIMAAVGQILWLNDEAQMHAVTGITGSGPAYVFYLMDALKNAAIAQGFSSETAQYLSLMVFKGTVALAEQSGEKFSILQKNVTSKGGTTFAAIEVLNAHQVSTAIGAGVNACIMRSQEISQQFDNT